MRQARIENATLTRAISLRTPTRQRGCLIPSTIGHPDILAFAVPETKPQPTRRERTIRHLHKFAIAEQRARVILASQDTVIQTNVLSGLSISPS
jgi:hypothetical protein